MRVGLLMDQASSYGRSVFSGVRQALLPRLDCRLLVAEPTIPAWKGLIASGIDATIVHASSEELAAAVSAWGGPAVNVSNACHNTANLPRCGVDDRAIGRMGAEFLLARAPASFAYIGRTSNRYGLERLAGFRERIGEAGRTCLDRAWQDDPRELSEWMADLPAPAAILVGGDETGLLLLAACHEAGLAVPDRVIVLSGTGDPMTCMLARPTLSGVTFDAERIGEEAAGLVLRLAAGEPAPDAPILIQPTHIEERASTALEALPDPVVAATLRWLRDHASEPIGVDHVAAAVGVGRRSLERRFSALIGRSIYQHLLAIRLDLAKSMLRSSDAPLDEVAARTGFAGARHLCEVFRLREGRTPASYRTT
jgi:LacI family transcriptional regulator